MMVKDDEALIPSSPVSRIPPFFPSGGVDDLVMDVF